MVFIYRLKSTKTLTLTNLSDLVEKISPYNQDFLKKGIYSYFDTFDWRLYREGYYLYLSGQKLFLYNFRQFKVEVAEDYKDLKGSDMSLQSGPLFSRVAPLIGIRALIRQLDVHRSSYGYRLLNDEKKTIAYLQIDQDRIKTGKGFRKLDPIWQISPLRGYSREVGSLLQKKATEMKLAVQSEDRLKQSLQISGRVPGSYSSKVTINLTAQMPALSAMKKIYLHLLDLMQKNERGIIDDIDTEFLHDYRVSIRRTRSGISQLKLILDTQVTEKIRKIFSFLGNATTELRDLDVFLLSEKQYKAMVPTHLRSHLDPFFERLKRHRKNELINLVHLFRSAKYKRALHTWESYLQRSDPEKKTSFPADSAIIQAACQAIQKRNLKILKLGKNIIKLATDESLHKLRIEAKKLRYLLEFFSSLFEQQSMQLLLKNLRQLQDNLGEHNDLTIQQKYLAAYADQIRINGSADVKTILAVGMLIGKLNVKELQVKDGFTDIFNQYAAKNFQKEFKFMLHSARKGME
jgi:CHAD domain-containing protein